jgi:Co/Zn/Cd efflux system component
MKNMSGVPGMADVHDLHIWNIRSGHTALSVYVVLADQSINQAED